MAKKGYTNIGMGNYGSGMGSGGFPGTGSGGFSGQSYNQNYGQQSFGGNSYGGQSGQGSQNGYGTDYDPFGNGGQTRNNRQQPQKTRRFKFNILLLIATVVAGIISWLIGRLLYVALIDSMPRPFLIGIVFAVLYIITAAAVFIVSKVILKEFAENVLNGDSGVKSALIFLAIGAVVIFGLATLFQWIYGMDFNQKTVRKDPTAYVFAIDESGSMSQNDPLQERYGAIESVLNDKPGSFRYMIYSFATNVKVAKDMGTVADGVERLTGESDGTTAMGAVLTRIIDDYEHKAWDGGDNPVVLLLTDGVPSDIGNIFSPYNVNSIVKRYRQAGIKIYTIGLKRADDNFMEKLAKQTGGQYISVDDASKLTGAMQNVVTIESSRDLLSERPVSDKEFLYGLMRIVFLLILSAAIGIAMVLAYGDRDALKLMAVTSLGGALIGALLMEFGFPLGMSAALLWLILWILTAASFEYKNIHIGRMLDI